MNAPATDSARLSLMLGELRLPMITRLWPEVAERADREGWSATRPLSALVEHGLAECSRVFATRIERHRAESHLPAGRTLDCFDSSVVPMLSMPRLLTLAAGDGWLDKGASLLFFRPPGAGRSRAAAGLEHAPIDAGYRVFFPRADELVQRLQVALRSLHLSSAINKVDRFDLLIIDDISCVRFGLIAQRYEHRFVLITANQPFSEWNSVFPDAALTIAAIDRLVHHATVFELNVESYRRWSAQANALDRDNYPPSSDAQRQLPPNPFD